jgi:DNA polymerase elongation subunit (family B)
MIYFQPADWIEKDVKFKYIVDVFGRTDKNEVAQVRLMGFRPYFFLLMKDGETAEQVQTALEHQSGKVLKDLRITLEVKLDAMKGFNGLVPVKVWKLSFPALWMFKVIQKTLKHSFKIGSRIVHSEDIYETNLPPFIRLFHELNISPASALEFEGDDYEPDENVNVDVLYEIHYKDIKPCDKQIPLLLAAYDIETYSVSGLFPVATNIGDEIMQIGISFRYSNDLLSVGKRVVFSNGIISASKDPSVKFISCKNERDLLIEFEKCILHENPDIICGYNTYGFDDGYIVDRCNYNKLSLNVGRIPQDEWKLDNASKREKMTIYTLNEKKTFELASGTFAVRYIEMSGRLSIDLLLSVRREQNLDSYKLDNVASTFLRDKVLDIVIITGEKTRMYEIHTKSTRGLFVGNLVRFDIVGNTINPYANGAKFKVIEVYQKKFIIELEEKTYLYTFDDLPKDKLEWSFGKDDISVKDMFAAHTGSADEKAVVAKYCIQDCDLVLTLMAKLDTLVNARGMADVCKVPMQYIFLRGQGIKIFSAIVFNASKRNQIIMSQENIDGDMSYEGAIVLPPKIGMYLDQPIAVLDFNSLYPSNMIAFNLSPDTLCYIKTYDSKGRKISQEGNVVEGFKIDEIGYDTYDNEKNPTGRVVCGYVQPSNDPRTIGIVPLTLDILLKKRKETRKKMETTEDDSQKSVLNGLQLAYKTVANSVYGQCGSRTSPIRKLEVAACTTAAGRDRIYFAKKVVEDEFQGEVIYGDTDSIFIKFPTKDLAKSIELGQQAAQRITELCRKPYKIEYEKTMFPFILFCRKRYVGMLYETDITKCYRKTMGVALKRRDNAPIVKDVFGGALDILMEKRDIKPAQEFVKKILVEVLQNKVPLEKYIITKQLRNDYKNPAQIAHRVLADRMAERDPGTAPQVGDRLPYIYVAENSKNKKQGDRIEHLDFVKEHNLKPDTEFYITNQIQNPVAQLFALAIENLDGYVSKQNFKKLFQDYIELGMDEEESTLKVLEKKEKELDSILFMSADYILKAQGKAIQKKLDSYFKIR